jgi:polyisoprenoid-binding protein YceI
MKNFKIWIIDPLHSDIIFKIRHLVISTVTGSFRKFEGRAVSEGEGFENAKISLIIDVKSIDTNQAQRDAHLQNGDFFSADRYPQITFESTSFTQISGSDFKMVGDLTLKGVKKSIELRVEYGGSQRSAQGIVKHGFEVTGTVNRKEFGMDWNVITDTGNLGLGEDIRLVANIQVSELAEAKSN